MNEILESLNTYRSSLMYVGAFGLLCLGIPHGLMWFDSGELALASATWGLAHPPGQPFYTLLGGLFYQLGGLLGLNLLSAVSLVAILAALRSLYQLKYGLLSLSSELIGLLWLMLYPVWDQGARIELYGLGTALGFWSLYFAQVTEIHLRDHLRDHVRDGRLYPQKMYDSIWLCGIFLGLCGATNAIFAIAFGLNLLWVLRPNVLLIWTRLLGGTLGGFVLPHLYFGWIIYASDGFIWGDFTSISGAWAYLTGSDYRGTGHSAWLSLPAHFIEWLWWSFENGAWLWCILTILLSIRSVIQRTCKGEFKRAFAGLPLVLFCGIFPLSYERYWPEVPDFTGYLLPVMGLSLLMMWHFEASLRQQSVQGSVLSYSLVCCIYLAQYSASPEYQTKRSQHTLAEKMAQDWLDHVPQNSLIFVQSDHWVFPLMYLQEVKKVRSDVLVFNLGFSRSSWYWRWLRKRHPLLPHVENTGSIRVKTLAEAWIGPVYAESLPLAVSIAPPPSPALSPLYPRFQSPPCPARWGVSIGCEHPLARLDPMALYALAHEQKSLSPITARILAAHSLNLSLHYWSIGEVDNALSLGYAALGKQRPVSEHVPTWWPAPPNMWYQGHELLIGEPQLALSVLELLAKIPPTER